MSTILDLMVDICRDRLLGQIMLAGRCCKRSPVSEFGEENNSSKNCFIIQLRVIYFFV